MGGAVDGTVVGRQRHGLVAVQPHLVTRSAPVCHRASVRQMATSKPTGRVVISLMVVSVALLVGILADGLYDATREKNVWTDSTGQRLQEATAFSYFGPEHCGWRSGLALPGLMGAHHFLRDEGLLADYASTAFQSRVTLPPDAVDTGWHRDGHELWLDPEGDCRVRRGR